MMGSPPIAQADDSIDRRLLGVAARIADEHQRVSLAELASVARTNRQTAYERVRRFKTEGRWPYRSAHGRRPEPAGEFVQAVKDAIDTEIERSLRDGRGEDDDTPGEGCWSGRGFWYGNRPRTTPAQACRKYLAEWREMTSTRAH